MMQEKAFFQLILFVTSVDVTLPLQGRSTTVTQIILLYKAYDLNSCSTSTSTARGNRFFLGMHMPVMQKYLSNGVLHF